MGCGSSWVFIVSGLKWFGLLVNNVRKEGGDD